MIEWNWDNVWFICMVVSIFNLITAVVGGFLTGLYKGFKGTK